MEEPTNGPTAAELECPIEVRGVVVRGDQRGRLLGFPTANVAVPPPAALPADGVYAGWFERERGERHACAVNVGRRPTFHEAADRSLLEAHLLDFDGDLYGEAATVRIVRRLRREQAFSGVDALVAQLAADVEQVRRLVGVQMSAAPSHPGQDPSAAGR